MCEHMRFLASVNIERDDGSFFAQVTVMCADCKRPFVFTEDKAQISPDNLQAVLRIAPAPEQQNIITQNTSTTTIPYQQKGKQ